MKTYKNILMTILTPGVENIFFLLFSLCAIFVIVSSKDVVIPGHLEPLGSHQLPSENIMQVDGFLKPDSFFEMFVKKSRAVLFKGACKDFRAYEMWNDDFLRNEYGELLVNVDKVKEENRDLSAVKMRMKVFLEIYHNTSWYMIDTLPKEMWKDLAIPLSLQCGGFLDRLQDIVIWFSSQGSKSHLHVDTVDNINCMIYGKKNWFLVDLENSKNIVMDHEEGDYCSVNVDKVDMIKYPFLRNISWHNVTVEAGDCIYVPDGWAHQVSSQSEKNIAVNFWWTPMFEFSNLGCGDKNLKSLTDVKFTPAEQYRFQLFKLLNSTGQPCNFECIHSNIVSEHTGKKLISKEDFYVIDSNGNGLIEEDEVQLLGVNELEKIFDGEEPGTVNIKGKFSRTNHDEEILRKDEL